MLKAIAWFRIVVGLLIAVGAALGGLNIVVWTGLASKVSPLVQLADQLIQGILQVEPNGIPSGVATFFVLLFFAVVALYFASGVILLRSLPSVPGSVIGIQTFVVLGALGYSILIFLLHGFPSFSGEDGVLFSLFPMLVVSVVSVELCYFWVQLRRESRPT